MCVKFSMCELHLNKLGIACAVLHTVGSRRDVHQSSRVQARAVNSGGAHGKRVRLARDEAGDVECSRIRARVQFVLIRRGTRPID